MENVTVEVAAQEATQTNQFVPAKLISMGDTMHTFFTNKDGVEQQGVYATIEIKKSGSPIQVTAQVYKSTLDKNPIIGETYSAAIREYNGNLYFTLTTGLTNQQLNADDLKNLDGLVVSKGTTVRVRTHSLNSAAKIA